jgi:hypothetical protein
MGGEKVVVGLEIERERDNGGACYAAPLFY